MGNHYRLYTCSHVEEKAGYKTVDTFMEKCSGPQRRRLSKLAYKLVSGFLCNIDMLGYIA
jgi:hypothetical protein